MPYMSGHEACTPPPLPGAPRPPPCPPTSPRPPPSLKVVREWEGVGIWPDATPPRGLVELFFNLGLGTIELHWFDLPFLSGDSATKH